jgi:hypothetical protein
MDIFDKEHQEDIDFLSFFMKQRIGKQLQILHQNTKQENKEEKNPYEVTITFYFSKPKINQQEYRTV